MNPTRIVMWALGLLLFLVGVYMLYFETGLSQFVSIGVITAGVVLIVGLIVMGFASGAESDANHVVREENVHHEHVNEDAVHDRRPVEARSDAYDTRRGTEYETREPRTTRKGRVTRHD